MHCFIIMIPTNSAYYIEILVVPQKLCTEIWHLLKYSSFPLSQNFTIIDRTIMGRNMESVTCINQNKPHLALSKEPYCCSFSATSTSGLSHHMGGVAAFCNRTSMHSLRCHKKNWRSGDGDWGDKRSWGPTQGQSDWKVSEHVWMISEYM